MVSTAVRMLCASLLAVSVWSANIMPMPEDACFGKQDGLYGIGCRSYTECRSEVATVVDCTPLVFNIGKLPEPGCDLFANTPPPCGDQKDCSRLSDISYPRLDDDCKSFYTCLGGIDMGTQICNPGTVFHWLEQICNWPENVYEPCGTVPLPNTTFVDY